MTDATTQAKKLLEAADKEPTSEPGKCQAIALIGQLGFTRATLAVAITLAEALESRVDKCQCTYPENCCHVRSAKALDAWEGLLPADQGMEEA